MRALAVGDNHLGAGPDLGRVPGDRLAEQEQVWRRALELARENDCDVVLHGGDLFDKQKPTPDEVLAALQPLTEHIEAGGCPVVMAIGNHERSGVSDATMPAALAALEALYVSQSPEVAGVFGVVTVCALPWAPTARIVAAENSGDRDQVNEHAAELLIGAARGLRAQIDGPAVLLTHYSISGSALPNGLPVDQLREPVLDLGELEQLGFDAIVAGHIHKSQRLRPGEPAEFYVGSPMPLNFGEAADEHGVWVLDAEDRVSASARFIPIESRSLVTLDVDFADWDTPPEWREIITPPMVDAAVVKVRVRATSEQARRLDLPALKTYLDDVGAHKVAAIEVTVAKVDRGRIEGLTEELTEIEALDAWMESEGVNGTRADALRDKTTTYLEAAR